MNTRLPLCTQEPLYRRRIDEWESFWNLEEADRTRWLLPTAPALQAAFTGHYPLTEYFRNKEMQLEGQLATIAWRETLPIEDGFIPHLQPYAGVTVLASAFGCEVDFFEHTLPWAHPVIKAGDSADKVYDLSPPSLTNGQLGEMLEFTDYFVEQTGGRYPIAQTDMQGPMDTAYLVWDSTDFMVAMYTHPEQVHHLMRLVTDLIIRYVKEQRARSPQFIPFHFPPLWLPDGQGIAISDDALAVLSPQTYEEFALPYVNELSEEFGGMFIHSCGNFTHQLDNLAKVHQLRGLNFGASEMPFEAVWDRFNGKTAIVPHLGLNKEIHFENRRAYLEHILKIKSHNKGLLMLINLQAEGPDKMTTAAEIGQFAKEFKHLLDQYA